MGHTEIEHVVSAVQSGWLAKGPMTFDFEEKFAEYVGAKHAIGMNSCTAALHVALEAAGIGSGDEVITTPMTFAASANTIIKTGATPVFVDIDPETGLIDPDLIEGKITPRTKAIVPVHYAGNACDLDKIYSLADKYGLYISEDAAHSLYTRYNGRLIGNHPKGSASFSFYATKNICTGEGGMLVTDDDEIARRARILITHGMSKNAWNRYTNGGSWRYDIEEFGYKYNMFDLQASLGLAQLSRLDELQAKREQLSAAYDKALKTIPGISTQRLSPGTTTHSLHLYIIKVDQKDFGLSRDDTIEKLKEYNIGTSVHFLPVHLMSAYRNKYGYKPGDFPNAEDWADKIISLPLYPRMSEDDVEYVAESLREIQKGF